METIQVICVPVDQIRMLVGTGMLAMLVASARSFQLTATTDEFSSKMNFISGLLWLVSLVFSVVSSIAIHVWG